MQLSSPVESDVATSPAPPCRRVTILVADDFPLIRESLALVLGREPDFQIVGEAADGDAAIEMAHRLRPNVVLMDVKMPKRDGVAATRQIKKTCPEIGVIALSLLATEETKQEMLAAGAADYVVKGGPSGELIGAIRRLGATANAAD